jgi:hypothetical protein
MSEMEEAKEPKLRIIKLDKTFVCIEPKDTPYSIGSDNDCSRQYDVKTIMQK